MAITPKAWPKTGLVPAEELVDPLAKFLREFFEIQKKGTEPEYNGFEIPHNGAENLLNPNMLGDEINMLERVLYLALTLGIKQGRRQLASEIKENHIELWSTGVASLSIFLDKQ